MINTGFLTVTVDQVGLLLDNGNKLMFGDAEYTGDKKLPWRLEPHSSEAVYVPWRVSSNIMDGGTPWALTAYAETATGKVFKGVTPALKSLVQIGNAKQKQEKAITEKAKANT